MSDELRDQGAIEPVDWTRIAEEDRPAVLQRQWEALDSEAARRLLQVAGLFSQGKQIPTRRLALLSGLDDEALAEATSRLQQASFLDPVGKDAYRVASAAYRFVATRTIPRDRDPFLIETIRRVEAAYSDPVGLVDQFQKRGRAPLDAEVAIALGLLFQVNPSLIANDVSVGQLKQNLQRLGTLFARLARNWDGRPTPVPNAYLVQQVYYHALELGLETIAGRAASHLATVVAPHFVMKWRTSTDGDGHRGPISAIAFTPDGRHVYTAADDMMIAWVTKSGARATEIVLDGRSVQQIVVAADGGELIYLLADGETRRSRTLPGEPLSDAAPAEAPAVAPRAFTGDGAGNVVVLAPEQDMPLAVVTLDAPITTIAVGPDNETILCGSIDGSVSCWRYVEPAA